MKKEQFNKAIDFIVPAKSSHKNREGKTVYHYSYNILKDSFNFQMDVQRVLTGKILPTGCDAFEFFNLEYLVNLSYCEGDVYAVFFETEKELKETIKSTMKYYEENEACRYDMTADEFFNRLSGSGNN